MKANFFSFIFLFISIGLFLPFYTNAQTQEHLLLSSKDSKAILKSIQSEVTELNVNGEILNFSSQEQAVLTIFRSSLRETVFDFLPGLLVTETVKIVLKTANFITGISEITMKEFLEEFEKLTVKEANKRGMEWLFQNEIKTGTGNIESTYRNFEGKWMKASFQYVITYQEIDKNRARVVVEFYSPNLVNPPEANISMGGYTGFVGDSPSSEKIDPFIVRVETQIEKIAWGWAVDSFAKTEIEVIFPDEVPRLQLAKELPYFLEEKKTTLENYLIITKRVINFLRETGISSLETVANKADSVYERIQQLNSYISQFSFFEAQIISSLQNNEESSLVPEIKSEIEELQETIIVLKEEITKDEFLQVEPELTQEEKFAQIQESLDDILEKIDIIEKETEKIIPKEIIEIENIEGIVEDLEEIEEETEELKEMDEIEEFQEEIEEIVEQKEIVFCDITTGEKSARNRIIINEIAWMGTRNSANDEWFELKNISGKDINLSGWQILDKENQIKIIFKNENTISNGGFYLLERTDDDSVSNITADKIYTGAFNNTNEALYLFNKDCALEDMVLADSNWSAGDKNERKSMERTNNLSWHTFTGIGQDGIWGTPKSKNSSPVVYISGGGGSNDTSPPLISLPVIIKILISEIQITGKTVNDEFIELYNPNDQDIDIVNWSLKKKTSSGNESNLVSSASFSGIIPSLGYFLIIPQPEDDGTPNYQSEALSDLYYSGKTYSIAANNTILLYDQNKNLIDKVGFGEAQDFKTTASVNPDKNQSLGRKLNSETQKYQDTDNNLEDFEIQEPTPKEKNKTISTTKPILEVEPLTLSFSIEQGKENFQSQVLFINNIGTGILEWVGTIDYTSPSIDGVGWLGIDLDFGTTPSQTSISPDISTLELGDYKAVINIESSGVENSPQEISVNLTIFPKPTQKVVINEIAWMGTEASATDEWIELYNNSEQDIDISGWQLKATDETPDIVFEDGSIILANDFYLLERTNDNTIEDISADKIYTGALKNEGEELKLLDIEGNLIDKVGCERDEEGNCLKWFIGDNEKKQTMERINPELSGADSENWANNNIITRNGRDAEGNLINGTPKSENSVSKEFTEIIRGFFVKEDLTLTYLGSPYLVEGSIIVEPEAKLTIEPGVVIKFKHNSRWGSKLKVEGSLEAIGQEDKKIIFTSWKDDEYRGDTNQDGDTTLPILGDWEWINFTNSISILDNVIVRYGGRGTRGTPSFVRGVVQVEGGEIEIYNSIIKDNLSQGLSLKNSSVIVDNVYFLNHNSQPKYYNPIALLIEGEESNIIIKNSTFKNNGIGIQVQNRAIPLIEENVFEENQIPIKVSVVLPIFKDNRVENNNINGILISGIIQDTIWYPGLTYIIERTFEIPQDIILTIRPGVIIKFKSGAVMNIKGTLLAGIVGQESVIFTSFYDDEYGGDTNNDGTDTSPTSWTSIIFHSSSTSSILDNVIVRYGGYYSWEKGVIFGAVNIEDVDISIFNSIFENNFVAGIYLINSDSIIENTIFQNNTAKYGYNYVSAGLYLRNSNQTITNSYFNNNYYGIYVSSGGCPGDLSGVIFGSGENSNNMDVYSPNCNS